MAGVRDLDRLHLQVRYAVEQPLPAAEQDGYDVEDELIDRTGTQRLTHGRRPTRDVDLGITGGVLRRSQGIVEA